MNAHWSIPLIGYFLGSVPFGLLIARIFAGQDIRSVGSGNIGAANVARNAGLVPGVMTLLLDAGKGYFAVWIAQIWTGGNARWMMVAAVAAVIGHLFPVWLRFKGGKGVATGLGVFIPICPMAVVGAAAVWILLVAFWRFSSLGSMVAAAAMPILIYLFYAPRHAPPDYVLLGTVLISVLILWKHRDNMRRLLAGEENRIGSPR